MSARISYLLPGNERKKNEPVCLVAIDAGRKLEIPVLFFGWQQTRESIFSLNLKIFLVWLHGGVVGVTPVI